MLNQSQRNSSINSKFEKPQKILLRMNNGGPMIANCKTAFYPLKLLFLKLYRAAVLGTDENYSMKFHGQKNLEKKVAQTN